MSNRQSTIGIADQIKALYRQVAEGELGWDEAAKLEEALHESIRPIEPGSAGTTSLKRSRRDQQVKWRAFACRLPYQLRGHFSDAQASALEALVFLCGKGGEAQIPIGTIAKLAQCSERTVQYMLRTALAEQILNREEIRRAKHFNAPSVFTILDSRLAFLADHMNQQFWDRQEIQKQSEMDLHAIAHYEPTEADLAAYGEYESIQEMTPSDGSPAPAKEDLIHSPAGQTSSAEPCVPETSQIIAHASAARPHFTGAKHCAHINKGFSIPTSGRKSRFQKDSRPSRPPASQTVFPPKPAENRHSGAHAPQNAWQNYQKRVSEAQRPRWAQPLGEAAIGLIEVSDGGLEALAQVVVRDENNNQHLNFKDWREAVEAIRRRKFPDVKDKYWESRIRIHGDRAYLAVLETWLKSETHSDMPIRSPDKYLIGILRRAPDQCRPEVSLGKILTKHAKVQQELEVSGLSRAGQIHTSENV
tara:strand:+ start:7434 stop:8855 length:1422 start_codon:yes stop_codon:yes gene_type:complete